MCNPFKFKMEPNKRVPSWGNHLPSTRPSRSICHWHSSSRCTSTHCSTPLRYFPAWPLVFVAFQEFQGKHCFQNNENFECDFSNIFSDIWGQWDISTTITNTPQKCLLLVPIRVAFLDLRIIKSLSLYELGRLHETTTLHPAAIKRTGNPNGDLNWKVIWKGSIFRKTMSCMSDYRRVFIYI